MGVDVTLDTDAFGVCMGGNNVQQWYLWSLLELPSTGTVSSVVIINPFLFPQHKSFHGSFIPCARTGFQKQFQLKNKVLFFNFQAICIRVSVVYLASRLVFTYLFKKKNGLVWFMDCSKSAIFYVIHLIWEGMEKGHIDHTNTMALPQGVGGYSFSFKKKCQLGLIYDMQSTPGSTTPLLSASHLGQCGREKRIICPKLLSSITSWIYNNNR